MQAHYHLTDSEMTAVVTTLSAILIVFMTVTGIVVGRLDPRVRIAATS